MYAVKERDGQEWWGGDRWTLEPALRLKFKTEEEARAEAEALCNRDYIVVEVKVPVVGTKLAACPNV